MDDLVTAVRELRRSIGDSQQAFATKLGMSLRAIANYEAGREPAGKALYKLERLAKAHGRHDLALTFERALAREMDWSHEPAPPVWVAVVREIVNNQKLCPGWPEIAAALVSELEGLIERARSGQQVAGAFADLNSNVKNLERWLVEARHALEGSAEETIDRLAAEWLTEHPGKTLEQAKVAVITNDPKLYDRYTQERADAARGTQFEKSLAVYGTDQYAAAQKKTRASSKKAKK